MVDMDKIVEYWSNASLEALETLRKQKADPRNPEIAAVVSRNMKILCAADQLMEEDMGGQSNSDGMSYNGSYADGNSYDNDTGMRGQSNARGRSRHYVRGHYSYAMGGRSHNSQHTGNTLSRMMDEADPREKEILERLLRKIDD